jgi:hypothetical protein
MNLTLCSTYQNIAFKWISKNTEVIFNKTWFQILYERQCYGRNLLATLLGRIQTIKVKLSLVHARKSYIGSRGTDPHILNIGAGWRSEVNTLRSIYSQKGTPLLILQDTERYQEPFWTFVENKKFHPRRDSKPRNLKFLV